jgi:hypothetical protein
MVTVLLSIRNAVWEPPPPVTGTTVTPVSESPAIVTGFETITPPW